MKRFNNIVLSRRLVLKAGAVGVAAVMGILPGRAALAGTAVDLPKNSDQIGFLYDQSKCIGCRFCQEACKKIYKWEEGVRWRRVLQSKSTEAFLSISCNHCENPACLAVCPVSAYQKRAEDGIVIHDKEKCIGCAYCTYACPYQTPQFSEGTGRVSKCHFCYEHQDQGRKPYCVNACPAGALSFGKLSELRQKAGSAATIAGLPSPELTKPSFVIIPEA